MFGEVTKGMDVIRAIESCKKGPGDRPADGVKIVKSGEVELDEPYHNEL